MLSLIGLGFIFFAGFFATKRAVVSIASNGGQAIEVPVANLKREAIIEFIEAVEREKLR